MGARKITVEISEPLLREAREIAAREGITLRTMIERGLQTVVAETRQRAPFKLRKASFGGLGLQSGVRDASLDCLREKAYAGRGD